MSTAAPSCSFITAAPYTPSKDTTKIHWRHCHRGMVPWSGMATRSRRLQRLKWSHTSGTVRDNIRHTQPVHRLSATHTHYRAPHTRPIRHTTTTMPTLCRRRSCHVVIPRVPLGRLHLASEWSEPVLPAPTTGTVLVHVPTVQLVRWSILAWRDVRQNQ